jgi:hypothetical protein
LELKPSSAKVLGSKSKLLRPAFMHARASAFYGGSG